MHMCVWIYTFKYHCRKKVKKYNLAKAHLRDLCKFLLPPDWKLVRSLAMIANQAHTPNARSLSSIDIYMTCGWHNMSYVCFWKWLCIIVVRDFMKASHYGIAERSLQNVDDKMLCWDNSQPSWLCALAFFRQFETKLGVSWLYFSASHDWITVCQWHWDCHVRDS